VTYVFSVIQPLVCITFQTKEQSEIWINLSGYHLSYMYVVYIYI